MRRPRLLTAAALASACLGLVGVPARAGVPAGQVATEEPAEEPTDDGTDGPAPVTQPPLLGLAEDEHPTLPPNVGGWPAPPPVSAASYVLLDVDAATVLAARDPDRLRSVASTVKMLTAITARRLQPSLDARLTAGREVAGLEGSGVGLGAGETWTLEDLLEGMLVRSGNDAAAAVAEQLGGPGGTDAFLEEMRADAERLGLDGAVLVSPSGLDDRNQLSAAHLAAIAVELLADPVLAEMVAADAVALPGLGGVPNRNELLQRDPTAVGVKTGFTEAAGPSLVAAARRDGRLLVAVVLDSADEEARFADAATLLDHAETFTSLPALPAVALGCPGVTVELRPAATAIVVPPGAADVTEVAWPPATCPSTDRFVVTPTLARLPLTPITVQVERTERADAGSSGDAALGRWLAGVVQDAMRAVPPRDRIGGG